MSEEHIHCRHTHHQHPFTKKLRGNIGEYWTQIELAKVGLDSDRIDKVFDVLVLNGSGRYALEVKTASKSVREGHGNSWTFNFKLETQLAQNAFDYAVCLGMDEEGKEVEQVFMIPHYFLYRNGQGSYCIFDKEPDASGKIHNCSYNKFAMCKLGFDIFCDKTTKFHKRKMKLARELLAYEDKKQQEIVDKFVSVFADETIADPNQYLIDKYGYSKEYLYAMRHRLKLTNYYDGEWHQSIQSATKKERDSAMTPKIKTLWARGYTRDEIKKRLRTDNRVVRRITKRLGYPRINPNRHKKKGDKKSTQKEDK